MRRSERLKKKLQQSGKKALIDSGHSLSRISVQATVEIAESNTTNSKPVPMVIDADEEPEDQNKSNIHKWTVSEVCDFVRNIPGCSGYADEFLMQEVDGEALLLIKPEHLVMALSMKLGPALKIVACIDALRPEADRTINEHD